MSFQRVELCTPGTRGSVSPRTFFALLFLFRGCFPTLSFTPKTLLLPYHSYLGLINRLILLVKLFSPGYEDFQLLGTQGMANSEFTALKRAHLYRDSTTRTATGFIRSPQLGNDQCTNCLPVLFKSHSIHSFIHSCTRISAPSWSYAMRSIRVLVLFHLLLPGAL